MIKFNSNKIKGLRNEHNDSQERLANILNISTTSYAQKERGERDFKVSEVTFIANYYNVEIGIFFDKIVGK